MFDIFYTALAQLHEQMLENWIIYHAVVCVSREQARTIRAYLGIQQNRKYANTQTDRF